MNPLTAHEPEIPTPYQADPEEAPDSAVARANAILAAVASAAERLLHTELSEQIVEELLAQLGNAASVSRVSVAEVSDLEAGPLLTFRYEWTAEGVTPVRGTLATTCYRPLPEQLEWVESRHAPQVLARDVSSLGEPARSNLESIGSKSFIVVPVHVEGRWEGTISLHENRAERIWSKAEIDALQAAARIAEAALLQRRAALAVQRRESILEAVSFAAQRFLSSPGWEETVQDVLGRLGVATGASRVFVFEGVSDPQTRRRLTYLRHEWTAAGVAPFIDSPLFQPYEPTAGLEEIQATLARGEVVSGGPQDFAGNVRADMEDAGTRSLVLIPIYVDGERWGAMGFDDAVDERAWSEAETGALEAAAATLGAAIHRRRIEDALVRRDGILNAVAYASRQLLEADSLECAIDDALEQLGRAAGVSRAYIFENHARADGQLVMDPRFEWADEDVARRLGEPAFHDLFLFEVWRVPLAAGDAVQQLVRELPDEDRAIFVAQDVHSTLLVPITVDGVWWGEVSFDDSTRERVWSATEMEALRAAAGTIGAAIERSLAERQLERQTHFLAQVHDAAIALDADRNVTYWNPGAERVYGYTSEEAIGRRVDDLIHPTPRAHEEMRRAAVPLWRGEQHVVQIETVRRRKDGTLIDVEISLSPLLDSRGEVEGFVSIARDISRRRRSEEALLRRDAILEAVGFAAERLLRATSVEDAIAEVLERIGCATHVSRVAIFEATDDSAGRKVSTMRHEWTGPGVPSQLGSGQVIGLSLWGDRLARDEVVRGHLRDFPPHERALLEPQGIKSLLDVPIVVGGQWWGDISLDDCVSERTWSDAEVEALRAAAGIIGASIARDRAETELRSREEQFQHAQKSESLGRLAGAIAHDFNNVLTVISGYGDLLRSTLDPGTQREDAHEIVKAASRGQALTQQLLSFSRRTVAQPRLVDLNTIVREIERMLERLLDRRIRLETSLEPGLAPVEADVGQIEQVLVNLAVNARDAMQESGGTLTISTRAVVVAGEPLVELRLADTGQGMDEETCSRVFEPFFTTKEPEKGTGLGLATVRDIVAQSGGTITVASTLGEGTTFTILFPHAGIVADADANTDTDTDDAAPHAIA
jgi:two-component system cell cycle sensor histidine kinase/response regulator CckA